MQASRQAFLGLGFDGLDQRQTLERIDALAARDGFSSFITPNVDHIVRLHRLPQSDRLWRIYREAEISVCDSRILQGLAALSGIALPLVTGSDLTHRLLERLDTTGKRVAIVGGNAELARSLRRQFPGIEWLQTMPPMGVAGDPVLQEEIAQFVEQSGARYVLFAIGSPQSELVCDLVKQRKIANGVGLCIGASLEFVTGVKARAPGWLQRARLEWLFRLLSEPKRLWRRYLADGPRIFLIWRNWSKDRALAKKQR